ncbi:MAG: lipoate--protein ligase family protein [Leptolyngbya foveolarum]|uniref:Lipoate--protein ligase family protein n=1 Tax=Leptolyngbya foveolarum TaxID=47253 RepID=A0A2W4TSJ0_9CYAN|nr:MAG: lipoate--protein ligase family protein [Leptolyngbya foveolarum]
MVLDAWRLVPIYEGTGLEQMAIDSWLLSQHAKGLQPPCLRFYNWRSPTLSLGYHQRQFPEGWNALRWNDQPIDLVRRPTGGRAVLHQGDLTYALITSGFKGSRRAVYQQLCQFLIQGWQNLGVALSFGAAGRGYIHNPNCFGTATAADLVMDDGYKLIGSAQVYRDGCLLQHGSMRLRPDSRLFETVFGEKILSPDLPEALLSEIGMSLIVEALTRAAEDCFGAAFEVRSLSPTEIAAALTAYEIKLEPPSV